MEIERGISTCTYTYCMATKTITITNEAYEKLAMLKEPRESFSEVINRIASKHSVFELIGLLTEEEAKDMKKHVEELNELTRKGMEEGFKRLK